jgi:hypothetical protein
VTDPHEIDQLLTAVHPQLVPGGGPGDPFGDGVADVARAVDVRQAQDDRGQAVLAPEGAAIDLSGRLTRSVRIDGPQGVVFVHGEGDRLAVHLARRGEDQASDPRPGGRTQHVECPHHICGEGVLLVLQRSDDGGLRPEVEDDARPLHRLRHGGGVPHIPPQEVQAGVPLMGAEIAQCTAREVVEDHHLAEPIREQAVDQVAADEAGAAGDDRPVTRWIHRP